VKAIGAWKSPSITQRAPHSKSQERVCVDAKLIEFELILSDPVHEFDAGDGGRGCSKSLRPSIGPSRSLIDRWTCSIKLLTYLDDRILH
jgi:hypothetical protein